MGVSSNFSFLSAQDERLARLGALAERYFFDDGPSALIKLSQRAEFLAKEVAARMMNPQACCWSGSGSACGNTQAQTKSPLGIDFGCG